LDAAQLLEDGARTVAQAGARLPLLQGLPQDIGQEGRPGCEPQRGFAFDARWDEWKGRVCESGKLLQPRLAGYKCATTWADPIASDWSATRNSPRPVRRAAPTAD
jgi:hypothetical protein